MEVNSQLEIIKHLPDDLVQLRCSHGHIGIYNTVTEKCKSCAVIGHKKAAREAAESVFGVPFMFPDDLSNAHNYCFKNPEINIGVASVKGSAGKIFKDTDGTNVIEINVCKSKGPAATAIRRVLKTYPGIIPDGYIKQRKVFAREPLPMTPCMVKIGEHWAPNKMAYSMLKSPIDMSESPKMLLENCFYYDV